MKKPYRYPNAGELQASLASQLTSNPASENPAIAIGTLVARVEDPDKLYRVTSSIGSSRTMFRMLPHRRSGKELALVKIGKAWQADGSEWTIVEEPRENPDQRWRVWLAHAPDSYVHVSANGYMDAMRRAAPQFRAEHHGDAIYMVAKIDGGRAIEHLVSIRGGRLQFLREGTGEAHNPAVDLSSLPRTPPPSKTATNAVANVMSRKHRVWAWVEAGTPPGMVMIKEPGYVEYEWDAAALFSIDDPRGNPYEVHSEKGHEQSFARHEDAEFMADELRRSGVRSVQVKHRGRKADRSSR